MFRFSNIKVIGDILFRTSEFFLESFSALWLLYKVVDIIENHGTISDTLPWIFGMAIIYAVYFALRKIYEHIIKDCSHIDVQCGFETMIFNKLAEVDMINFDNPDFYAEYNKAIFCVKKAIFQIFAGIVNLIAFSVMLLNTIVFICTVDAWLLLFCLFSISTYHLGKQYGDLRAIRKKEMLECERKQDYVRKVFLDRRYAQEIRTSNVKRVLDLIFKNATKDKKQIIERHGSHLIWVSFWRTICSVDGVEIICYTYAALRILIFQDMSIAELAVLFSAVIQYTSRLRRMMSLLAEARENSSYVDSLRNFLKIESSFQGKNSCNQEFKTLEIKDVSFSYGNQEILHNITFQIKAGEIVMIAGPNGAGKSTLIKLLLQLYKPYHGKILYNGQKIDQLDPKSYRNHFSYMSQDFQVYDMSIEENILMQNSDETLSSSIIDEAIKFSGIDRWLTQIDQTLQKNIGRSFDPTGLELSGGQKQSIALARLKAHPCDIYILDEPSSSLDPIAEAELFHRMRNAAEGKTILFISHRLVSAQYADRVILLNDGRIVETGTHNDLMHRDGLYAELFRAQSSYYQEDIYNETK